MAVRLADYFVVVGFDHTKERSGSSQGAIQQRYPVVDWPDVPFIPGIETFCQPQGWSLANQPAKPTFFVVVLTDINGNRHNAAIFAFTEPVALAQDHERHSLTYAPRCLVLIARHAHINILRQCLGLIYTAHVDRLQAPLETLIGNMLGAVTIPPPGSPPLRFSLGAGDLQVIEPRKFAAVPVTGTSVYSLFSQLSAHNVVQLLCAAMAEFKIVFFSQSCIRLHQSCHAIISLMYPFKYTHIYVPLLPSALIEVLNTPTPFIIGCHASLREEILDIYDVMMVDLDSGSLDVPQCVTIPKLPDSLQQRLHADLCMILQPDLLTADEAFPSEQAANATRDRSVLRDDPAVLDKQIRAVFLRIFAQMLQGYRCCLTVVRIHPRPLIVFNRSAFLSREAKNKSEFVEKLLNCMFFQQFVVDRGPPYRVCDLFDEVYVEMQHLIKSREQHIQDIAKLLYENEHHGSQFLQRVPQPTQGAFTRIHQPAFPPLVAPQITAIIEQSTAKPNGSSNSKNEMGRIVPNAGITTRSVGGVERKLDVLRNCVKCIFDKNLSEARKCIPGVIRAFENGAYRAALAYELQRYKTGNFRVELELSQFDLVVRLMNCALQDDPNTHVDTIGIAILLLPLTQTFCRRLAPNVVQFAYTCLQEHAVWQSAEFWEAAFHQDVERNIIMLYQESKDFPPVALELCATQMKLSQGNPDKFQTDTHNQREEKTVYSQAVEYIYLITCLRIPPDVKSQRHNVGNNKAAGSENNSVCDTDSIDGESSFAHEDNSSQILRQGVIKFIARFIDKVCTDAGVTEEHMRQLHSMIPQRVDMQLEDMRAVHRESERLPPVLKAKIRDPCLLAGETHIIEGIRAYLLPDGRQEDLVMPLIPAEGALFVTNYRIVFKGTPIDPYLCEHNVIRAFPIASLMKEKKIALPKDLNMEQCHSDFLQLRSHTFELMKIAVDLEVSSETIDLLRQQWQNAGLFALSKGQVPVVPKLKEKHSTLRFKKKMFQTAVKAGISKGRSYAATLTQTLPNDRTILATLPDEGPFSMAPWEATLSKDYQRLQLNGQNGLLSVGHVHTLCKSYPPLVVVPSSANSDRLQKVAKCYRHGRFPVVTWRHPRTKALLLRGSALHGKGIAHRIGAQGAQGETSMWIEQEKYIGTIIAGASHCMTASGTLTSSSFSRSNAHRWSGGKAFTYRPPHRESISDRHSLSSMLSSSDNESTSLFNRAALYIVSEKSQTRGVKAPHNSEFIPVESFEVGKVRAAFKQLCSAVCPATTDVEQKLLTRIEESGWLQLVQELLYHTALVVDLINEDGSSVVLCLEEGWDVTCQLSALVQLCLDPHYRKIDGFCTLIEKEWLAFGHRFALRGNISQQSAFTPIFLQFLDCVHQLLNQYPTSFEFNQFYLRFLAYHSVSGRFRTFINDGGVAQSVEVDSEAPDVFEYIQKVHSRAPIFHNYWYVAEYDEVLKPQFFMANLEVWEYYLEGHLSNASPYEFEIVLAENESQSEDKDEESSTEHRASQYQRRINMNGYNHTVQEGASFPLLLEELRKAELELARTPQKWKVVWNRLEAQNLPAHQPTPTGVFGAYGVARGLLSPSAMDLGASIVRKVDVLVRGLSNKDSSHAHRFERHYYNTPTYCDHCSKLLLGLVKPGMKCLDCGYNCHDKCHDLAPSNCSKVKQKEAALISQPPSNPILPLVESTAAYDQLTSRIIETKTFEGYLSKRGALLKGWKQRWFVLDSTKHQLRYYEGHEDHANRGVVELSEVLSVNQHGEMFELRTRSRTYGLMADNEKKAQEWVEKIQSCLQ